MIVKEYQRLEYGPGEGGISDPNGLSIWLETYMTRSPSAIRKLVVAYLQGNVITNCFDMLRAEHDADGDVILDWFVSELRRFPINDLVGELKESYYALSECIDNIPQLSSLEGSTLGIVDVLSISETPLTYVRLGYQLYASGNMRNETAKRKYGENAAKFAAILDLVRLGYDIKDPSAPNRIAVELTRMGMAVARAQGDKMEIIARLLLRSALFRDLVCSESESHERVFWSTVSLLSPATRLRRTSAFSAMLNVFKRYGGLLSDNCRAEELLCRMRR